jgi:hypothetical protein
MSATLNDLDLLRCHDHEQTKGTWFTRERKGATGQGHLTGRWLLAPHRLHTGEAERSPLCVNAREADPKPTTRRIFSLPDDKC